MFLLQNAGKKVEKKIEIARNLLKTCIPIDVIPEFIHFSDEAEKSK